MRYSTFEKKIKLLLKTLNQNLKAVDNLETNITTAKQHQALSLYETINTKNTEYQSSLSSFLEDDSTELSEKEEESLGNFNIEIEELVINLTSKLRPLLPKISNGKSEVEDSLSEASSATTSAPSSHIRLPKLQLKSFDGKASQWIVFYNLFDSTVHSNKSLSDVEKFQYLLSSLQGEALTLVKALPLTNENYSVAYNALTKRYHNPRVLQTYHLNQIIDIPSSNESNVYDLRNFISKFQEHSSALSSIGVDIIENNPVLLTILLRKFSVTLKTRFETRRIDNSSMPSPKEFIDFLEDECSYMENANLSQSSTSFKANTNKPINSLNQQSLKNKNYQGKSVTFSVQHNSCNFCNEDHFIYQCIKFKELNCSERFDFIKNNRLCTNCLSSHHSCNDCPSKFTCKVCGKKHHTLLHRNESSSKQNLNAKGSAKTFHCGNTANRLSMHKETQPPGQTSLRTTDHVNDPSFKDHSHCRLPEAFHSETQTSDENKTTDVRVSTLTSDISHSNTLLGTTLVKLISSNGHSIIARALVDSASNRTLISEDLAQKLCLKRQFSKYTSEISGISSTSVRTKGSAQITIFTLNDKLVYKDLSVLILNRISNDLPSSKITSSIREKLVNFRLADPSFDKPSPIQMIIGADLFMDIIRPTKHSLGENMPYALETIFGFVIIGRIPPSVQESTLAGESHFSTFLSINEENSLHKLMSNFWQLEQSPEASKLTPGDLACEAHFNETHSRFPATGKYIVKLPFKETPNKLGDSSFIAKKRFFNLERKLNSQPECKKLYCEFMNDYKVSGHMSLLEGSDLPSIPHYFLPHHGVFKESSSTTRLRVVFDGSCPTSNGTSLNDILHVGPKLQNDIPSIITEFRRFKYVFTTDVKQMFRGIDLHCDDRNFQLIYWRDNPQDKLCIYKLNTVTYGLACSPFLANRVIHQLTTDEQDDFPVASSVLKNHIYVDDIALGSDDIDEAIQLQSHIIELLKRGGFELRKWTSNDERLLSTIPKEFHEQPVNFHSPDQPLVNLLGLQWIPSNDMFTYKISISQHEQCTKRNVLSDIAKIFDPCGFLAPVVIFAKIFIQTLWIRKLEWDTPLPQDLSKQWLQFLQELPMLENVSLQRHFETNEATDIQLHGFSDSSESAYSACIYLRTTSANNSNVKVALVMSKTRVAPLKRTTLPRLELCAAHLLANMMHYCIKLLNKQMKISSIYAWTDSTITLSWISTPPYKLKTFVANRVAEIQELLHAAIWSHVPSSSNPADCASRGLYPNQLLKYSLWWEGPKWLLSASESWPKSPHSTSKLCDLPEMKTTATETLLITSTATTNDFELLNKYSNWGKLQRVTAYILRFRHNASNKNARITGLLSTDEIRKATFTICRLVQLKEFSSDYDNLTKNKPCKGRISSLAPFIDESGLIRVGGRLKHANIQPDAKYPILMPKTDHVTTLIVDSFHLRYLHAGPQLLQSIISQHFWILSARSLIRLRIHKCLTCFRAKPPVVFPKMADLPAARINPSPPFEKTGLDYAGPFQVKIHTLRRAQTVKAYLCIFVCFATKAVHIEVASDLTADTFTAALTRFIARRGAPTDVYLDNATNFVGAYNQLNRIKTELFRNTLTKSNINNLSIQHFTKFHFNPPSAPHQGGLWESGVKSAKTLLKKVMGETVLTLEEFQTLAVRVESMLNSRPLCPLTADPSELDVLTPGHFIIGRPMTSLPEADNKEVPMNRLKRWQTVQAMSQRLWDRWQREYLHTLQQRSKWTKHTPNIKIDDIVLIHENSPPQTWPRGRVIATHPGSDGVTRVATLRTANGEVKRPVVKLSSLPHF